MPVERPRVRDDIVIRSRERGEETVFIVLDPIRSEYHEIDELQNEILIRLDGQKTLAQISADLNTEHGLEIPEEMLAAFVDEVQSLNFLDPASDLRLDSARSSRLADRIKADLELRGVRIERSARSRLDWLGVHGAPKTVAQRKEYLEHRKREHARAMMDRALDHLDRGEMRQMAEQLRFLLDMKVDDWRPRYLHQALLKAHLEKPKKQSIWWWTFPVGNPDRMLRKIDRWIGPLVFRKMTLVVWAIVMLASIATLATDWDRLVRDLSDPLRIASALLDPLFFVLFYSVGPLIIFFHEVSHGLACTHFGGRVREMGLLVSYLSPTAYCDISSSYLFSKRAHRIIVSIIGTIFHGFVWALFVFIYHFAVPDSYVGKLATISVPILALTALFGGWNPLIKNDAYFALTDWVDYPNLRHDAFDYLKLRILSWLLGEQIQMPEHYAPKGRLLFWYAVPSAMFTALTIYWSLAAVMGYLIEKLRAVGLVLAIAGTFASLGPYLLKFGRWLWTSRKQLWAYPRFRRVSVGSAVMVALAFALPVPLWVEASCRVAPELVEIRSPQNGRLASVLVEPGDEVHEGQVIAHLETNDLRAALAEVEGRLTRATKELERLMTPARREEVVRARSLLEGALNRRALAVERLERLERMAAKGLQRVEHEQSAAAAAAADTQVADARRALAEVTAGARQEELNAARAEITAIEAEANALSDRIAQATIKSPANGVISSRIGSRGDPMRFADAKQGQVIASLLPAQSLILEADVPLTEPLIAFRPGAAAIARLIGTAHTAIAAEVTSVSPKLEGDGAASKLVVSMRVSDRSAKELPGGLSGRVRVTAGWHPVAWHAYVRARRLVEIDLEQAIY
jgi:multidrug efflux pump subunit AcrA (membrane-fusion protein)